MQTATALCGITYFLTQHLEAMKRAREEVRSNISCFEDMTLEKLAGLEYTNACLQETMRIYPPVRISSSNILRDAFYQPCVT